jgi:NAD(P)-dependent dehydrogenase (short-subunit alcohol dehydrogenase family)
MSRSARPKPTFGGQCAIVTGASRGIGRAIAVRLCQSGADVVCVARSPGDLAVATAGAGACAGLAIDLADQDAGERVLDFSLERFGRIDVLVHAAGIMTLEAMADASPEALEEMLAVNLLAPYAITKAALPELKRTQGQVLFINSSIIRAANLSGRGGYAATKHALKAVADSLRDELNEHGVRVISLMPGTTATDSQERLHRAAGKPYRPENLLQPEDVARAACDALALPRTAEVTDLYIRPMRKS